MEYQYAFFLGSHPDLSAAESWAVLTRHGLAPRLVAASSEVLLVATAAPLPDNLIQSLGGVDRIAQVLGTQSAPWTSAALWALLSPPLPAKKITFGISTVNLPPRTAHSLGKALKRLAQTHSLRARFITGQGRSGRLNAAQVIFNQLHHPPHFELTLLEMDSQHLALRTLQVQDIVAYEQRDTARPARDARVGMLPPKLAQIMINLATDALPLAPPPTLFDPFCGMGTILQEGWLMGYTMIGSDLSPAMITATRENLAALPAPVNIPAPHVFTHDARQAFPPELAGTVDAIVTEPYLGRPLSRMLTNQEAAGYLEPLAELYLRFFTQSLAVLKPAGHVLIAFPAVRRGSRGQDTLTLLPDGFLDAVEELGYSRLQLIPEELAPTFPPFALPAGRQARGSLLYARPKALVGRELTLWNRL